jgi:predicted metal-binding membrane protein
MLRRTTSEVVSDGAFFGVSALLFAASATVTIVWSSSMSEMGGMPMPNGWTMSMAWMRMLGQTWPAAAAAFLGMWVVMMAAMMLPSLTPMLWRYRRSVVGAGSSARLGCLTAVVAAGYFAVWTLIGALAFPLGAGLAAAEMREPALARAVPLASGVVMLIAGALQFTSWKARQLACCRGAPAGGSWLQPGRTSLARRTLPPDFRTAWREGVRLGLRCSYCCAGLTAILLVLGMMDLRAMAIVTAAITAERLVPGGQRVARAIGVAIGVVIVGAAGLLIARAVGLA